MILKLPDVHMETVVSNSFRDYHVRGFDYICIKRSAVETVKLYFFDGDVSKIPEVVNPHDHRYDFKTTVIAGKSQNVWFSEASVSQAAKDVGTVFNRFAYETPLLGGEGFTWVGETRLVETQRKSFKPGHHYSMNYREVHTIRMMENETVLCLVQFEDRVARNTPTLTFTREEEAPSLTGLYKMFSPDQILARLSNLTNRVPGLRLPRVI